jgi:hypothetical protein
VCHAICEEYVDEVMTAPSTPEEWIQLADRFLKNFGTFQIALLLLMART